MVSFPNILLIVIDCARSDKWLDNERSTSTPHIERLRKEGMTFPNTITETSSTTPSFVTLLSGLYSPRHGIHQVWGYRMNPHLPNLTESFANLGYHTYAEVTGPLLAEMGLDRGFEHYEYRAPCDYLHTKWGDLFINRLSNGYYREPWFLLLHLWEIHLPRQVSPDCTSPRFGRDDYEKSISSLDSQLGRVFNAAGERTFIIVTGDHGEKTKLETYQDGTAVSYTREILKLDKSRGGSLYKIASFVGPSVLQQLYAQFVIPNFEEINRSKYWRGPDFSIWDEIVDKIRLLRLRPRVFIHDFLSLNVPIKLTATLKKRGLLNESIAIRKVQRFLESSNKDKLIDMHTRMLINSYRNALEEGHVVHVYDFLVKVPLILKWPGRIPEGISSHHMIRFPDILPTVLELIGVDKNTTDGIDGKSFKPLIEGKKQATLPAYLSVSGLLDKIEIRGVRTESYKYTYGPKNPELPEELYNLEQDPGEIHNIAQEAPDTCERLRQLTYNSFHPDTEFQAPKIQVDDQKQKKIEKHLQDLGYID